MKLQRAGRYEVLFAPDGGLYMIPTEHIFAKDDNKRLLVATSTCLYAISVHTFVSLEGYESVDTHVEMLYSDYLGDLSQVRAIYAPRRYEVVMETGGHADFVNEYGQLQDLKTHEETRAYLASLSLTPSYLGYENGDVCNGACIAIDEEATLGANTWATQEEHYAALMALRPQWETTPAFVSQYNRERAERRFKHSRDRRRRERVTNR